MVEHYLARVRAFNGVASVLVTPDGADVAPATGAEPTRLTVPGALAGQVHYLRTYADCRALIEHASTQKGTPAKSAVVLGSSFIGLEVAAALRARLSQARQLTREAREQGRLLGHARDVPVDRRLDLFIQ